MIHHVSLHVSDYLVSKNFYLAALHGLGYVQITEFPDWKVVGIGEEGKPDLWIKGDGAGKPTHIAFVAESRDMVNDFYNAAIKAGGEDNGKPGYRKKYSPGYYGAFVLDPDGNNVEVVYMDPQPED